MGWLSLQQRKIIEFLCTCRQPVPVKEIARRLFISPQTAAGQLGDLREKHTFGARQGAVSPCTS